MDSPALSLRINTSIPYDGGDVQASPAQLSPNAPLSARERARSISQGLLPQLRLSTEKTRPAPEINAAMIGMEKARNESRKLLSHILVQLEARNMPPPVLEGSETRLPQTKRGIAAVVRSFSGKSKSFDSKQGNSGEDSDEEWDPADRPAFFTDATLELMVQLKDTLHISIDNKWDIFTADISKGPGRLNSLDKPRRKRRLSSQNRSRSRSSSPNRLQEEPVQAPELVSQCLSILYSVVLEDCRFKVYAPSLLKPPHALQGVTLDVAQILIHLHREEPRILSQIGFAVVPAFQTFPPSMHLRLLSFFDDGVLGGMLAGLQKLQGTDTLLSPAKDSPDEGSQGSPPFVSITVEEPQDETTRVDRWQRWSKRTGASDTGHQSSSAPEQDVAVYYLSSLVEPLLSVVLENVDLFSEATPVTQRFHRLFIRLTKQKPDVYLDVLGVIAYHNPRSRQAAVSLLASYWPKSVGHVVVSRPLSQLASISEARRPDRRSSITRRGQHAHDHPYAHQFIPWRFVRPLAPIFFDNFAPNHCRACSEAIEGFGLLCPFCMCAVHFDCYDYPEGSFFTEYSLKSDPDIQKVAVHRFCHVLPNRHGNRALSIRKEQHLFRMVNTFSMSLCCLCRKPLWGTVMQGYKCGACHLFVHPSCLSSSHADLPRCRAVAVDSSFVTIPYPDLRRSFVDHYREFVLSEEDLNTASHEEVSVLYSILWTQQHILDNGIAMGSIVVSRDSTSEDGAEIDDFELQYLVQLYEAYLSSGRLSVSNSLLDYLSENRVAAKDHLIFFDWNTLAFMASVIKLPPSSANEVLDNVDTSALLSVSQAGRNYGGPSDEESTYPFEIASLAYVRDAMGDSLDVHRDAAARQLLIHLHHLGLFERHDSHPLLLEDNTDPEKLQCLFPLPFGFDITLEVETLVATIEACLSDISLTVNEVGLLLLVRRFWPNGMLSEYSFRRLAKAILSWILSEDSNLALILREYVARNRNLPGVRSGEAQSWPAQSSTRPTASVTASNGGDYIASRRALLSRYAGPWMLALHDLDIIAYAGILYDLLCEHAEDGGFTDPFRLESSESVANLRQARELGVVDRLLRSIIKVSQASMTFTAFDDLFQQWLSRIQNTGIYEVAIPSLPRLFTREDGSQRSSLVFDGRNTMGEAASLANVNPMQKLLEISFSSGDGYRQGLRWLCIFASSGVDIPASAFLQFAASAGRFHADLEDCATLAKAGLYAAWLRSIGRQELQVMVGMLHEHLSSDIVSKIWSRDTSADALAFVRQSLATCLLLYGCDRQYLHSHGLIKEEEIKHLPSRRKVTSRASTMSDPVIVDAKIMNVVKVYVEQHFDELSCMLAKFLNAFVSQSAFVESYEVDNFILRNSTTLSTCIWDFYAIQAPELSLIRAALFVRVMAVDQQPLISLLLAHLHHGDWEIRLETILRLFRITLDVTSPAFVIEDRQWAPSITEIFRCFFSAIWADEKEEVRLAADTWAQTLLPSHLDSISRCWNEALAKAPISERLKLVNFLSQLRPHFPAWKLLSWDVVIETLLETDFLVKNGNAEDGAAAAHLSFYGLSSLDDGAADVSDPVSSLLRVSLISLSLTMISDGILVDIFSLLRLKDQLARTLGYQDVVMIPSANGHTFHVQFRRVISVPPTAFPCIADLMLVMDSARPYELSCSAMGGPDVEDETLCPLLVGSGLVDILLGLFVQLEDPASLPPQVLKNMLKALIIAMQKHDFDSRALRHLHGELRAALRCCLTLLLNEEQLSLELRQIALSNCQVFINRWPNTMGVFLYDAIEAIVKVMVSLHYDDHREDSLVAQARAFLEGVMITFHGRGILNVLFKRVLPPEFFNVLAHAVSPKTVVTSHTSLRDALLRDTLTRASDNEADSYQLVLDNVNHFIETVHHSHYSAELLQVVDLSLTTITHRITEWPVDAFDASSLLFMIATLIQNNKAHSRDFLVHATTILRLVLVRCRVSVPSLSKILHVTSTLYRKADRGNGNVVLNQVASAFVDSLSEILTWRNKPIPSGLSAAIEVVVPNIAASCIPPDRFPRLAEDGLTYLYSYNALSPWHQDFLTCQAVVKLILQAALQYPDLLRNLEVTPLGVRTWNMILLSALSMNDSRCCVMLLPYFSVFVPPYYISLEPLQLMTLEHATMGDLEPSIISRAFISIKLWLLAVFKSSTADQAKASIVPEEARTQAQGCSMVWNDLWPPFEAVVVNLLQANIATNSLLLASSSVADLFLFIHHMRIAVALESSSQVAMLNQLRSNSRLESKMSRVLRAITEPPPSLSLESFVLQAAAEISAEEKLEAAKLQESMKPVYDRSRRAAS